MGNSGSLGARFWDWREASVPAATALIWAPLPTSEPAEGRFVHELAHCLYLSGAVSPPPSLITPRGQQLFNCSED